MIVEARIIIVDGDVEHFHMPVPSMGMPFEQAVWAVTWPAHCKQTGKVYVLGSLLVHRKPCPTCFPKLRDKRHGDLVEDLLELAREQAARVD